MKYITNILLAATLIPSLCISTLRASTLVGSLPGDVVVTNKGNATYSMPISLPEGVAGMKPELSIEYDSTGGNGLLGMGFSLGGLSAISRTATTLEQDNMTDGIDFDDNDRFVLDGQRLVCVSGTYGAPGSEYRTEIDSFVRVIAHGTATSGPDYFTVETKSGLTKTYGTSTATSLVYDLSGNPSDGAKISWLLEKIEDSNGNEINYTYVQSTTTKQKYLSEIVYGTAEHQLKVTFEREVRDDKISSFMSGVDFSSDERLKTIRVLSGGVEIGKHTLNYAYGFQSQFSKATSVVYTDVATGETLSSDFEWQDESVTVFPDTKIEWFDSIKKEANYPEWRNMTDGSYVKLCNNSIDMNGDGLLDRVSHYNYDVGGGSGLWVALNNGSEFDAKAKWFSSSSAYGNLPELRLNNKDQSSVLIRLLDMNGDGLPDRVGHYDYVNGGGYGLWVALNNGSGFDVNTKWFSSVKKEANYPEWRNKTDGSYEKLCNSLLDMNGDGLPDRVGHYDNDNGGGYGLWIALNNGSGFDAKAKWFSSLSSRFGNSLELRLNNKDQNSVLVRLLDINGDGLPDRVGHYDYANGGGYGLWVSLNQSKPTLLSKITNNFGVSTEITYKPLTDKSVYIKGVNDATPKTVTVQSPMNVVSSITKDIGIEDANGDPILYTSEYTYAEARYHTHGRGFLGFRVFESYDAQTQITKTDILHHDFPYTGMTISSSTYGPNGQMLTRAENVVDSKVTNATVDGKALTLFPYNVSSEEWKAEYDPTDFSTMTEAELLADLQTRAYANTLTTNDFDANGNNIRIEIDYGDGYTQLTENTYAYDNVATWYLGRLSSATVTSTAPDTTGQDETIVRTSEFTYDSNGLLLTETVQPGNALAVTTTYTRDSEGRIISTRINPADGPAFVSETHSVLDPTGRFYTKTTNALGHTETRVYEPTRGWLLSQTGPNGRTTYFTYDALGRAIREDRPDGTWATTEYIYDDSQSVTNPRNGLSATSKYRVTTTGSVAPPSTAWYDRTGRAIRACSVGFDRQTIYKDTGYNEFGQVDCVAENYYAAEGPTHWTKTTFDELGRVDVVTAPDGTRAKTIYNGHETTTIRNYQGTDTDNPNANDQIIVTLLNAKGDSETVTTFTLHSSPLTLHYRYDGVGNLLETVDSEGRVISMTYDILGNKIAMDDPDMGVWSYTYNALGQLVSQTDAVGNVSAKTYDILGRIIEESYDAADPAIATVTHNYYYDGADEHQQLGKLHLEKSSTGFRRSHYYDDLGRTFLTLNKIEGRWFYQQTDYDSYSRPVRLTHYWRPPEMDEGLHDHYLAWYSYSQETVYDNFSFVTEVRDANGQTWWSSPTYNQHGQMTSYLAGNGLRTNNEFDTANQTLERVYVTPTSGGSNLLDHRYEFDSIGNITQRTDEVQGLIENMTYDRLNRLKTATVVGAGTVSVDYDDLGNILNRTSTSGLGDVGLYGYVPGTNRVSNAGGRAFTYNANGAITGVSGDKNGSIT